MSAAIALQRPDFSTTPSHGLRGGHHNLHRLSSSWTLMVSSKRHTISPSNVKFDRVLQRTDEATFHGDIAGISGQFIAREAQIDEHWTAAWLRAESHWEDQEQDRYVVNFKRKFAEQEFNAMKQRYNSQLGEFCKCIVMVKNEDSDVELTALESVVGTLDLSIQHLSHGETFPGERIKAPFFCLVDREESSRYGYITNLCVAKSARRQGIASRMLQFAVISAKENGVEKVFVHVYRNNKAAQGLYQKMGFEVVNEATSQLSANQTYLLCLET